MSVQIIRDYEVYCRRITHHALRAVATGKGIPSNQLADDILWEHLKKEYPEVIAHLETRDKTDRDLYDRLKKQFGNLPLF